MMGTKVHPYGFRLGYTKPWKSRWFVERDYDKLLLEDVKLKARAERQAEVGGRQRSRDRASGQQARGSSSRRRGPGSSSGARALKSTS